CGAEGSDASSNAPTAATGAAAAPSTNKGIAVRIEEAERALDAGKDAAGARAKLDAVLADPEASPEQRDQATIALSRALEALGDKEGATVAIEKLMSAHADDPKWPGEDAGEKRLFLLLTGRDR